MKKKSIKSQPKLNKFCGESDCKLGFPHWHSPTFEYINVAATPRVEINTTREVFGTDFDVPPAGADVSRIAEAIRKLPCNDDPEADRFKGMSKEEINIQLLQERIEKLFDVIDVLQLSEVDHAEGLRCKVEALTKFVEKWYEENTVLRELDSQLFTARYKQLLNREPGFGTAMLASMAGGASLLCFFAVIAALAFFANQHWG